MRALNASQPRCVSLECYGPFNTTPIETETATNGRLRMRDHLVTVLSYGALKTKKYPQLRFNPVVSNLRRLRLRQARFLSLWAIKVEAQTLHYTDRGVPYSVQPQPRELDNRGVLERVTVRTHRERHPFLASGHGHGQLNGARL